MRILPGHLLGPVLAVLVLFGLAPDAKAHAILVDSQPPVRGSVRAGPVAVAFRYNSRVDAGRSRLLLVRADKTEIVLPILPNSPPDQLLAQVELPPGHYTVRWQVLAVDGHITRGDVPFDVTAADASPGNTTQGNTTQGNTTQGNTSQGNTSQGNTTASRTR